MKLFLGCVATWDYTTGTGTNMYYSGNPTSVLLFFCKPLSRTVCITLSNRKLLLLYLVVAIPGKFKWQQQAIQQKS